MKEVIVSITFDPQRNEIDALQEFVGDMEGKRVFEIGMGGGRLTWRYAANAGYVVGIDPNPERIASAQQNLPEELRARVEMLETTLEEYRLDEHEPLFDVALMSWAL
jgi:ubiquinone/menaquinone biosynthesis C-methylase UbiE